MRTGRGFVAAVSALLITLAAGASMSRDASARQVAGDDEYRLIDALNDRVQERFRNLGDGRFGYGRVAAPMRVPHRFDAESASEAGVIRDLERAGLRVVVYVTGRAVLRSGVDRPRDGVVTLAPSLVKGPAIVTPKPASASLSVAPPAPAARDLVEESRNAMLAFGEVESTEFTRAGWTFIARPVRASDEICFSCHRDGARIDSNGTLRLEKLLGAVLYGFRPLG